MLHTITVAAICYPMMWRQVVVEADQICITSCQLDLPDVVAKSTAANPDQRKMYLGSEGDRVFVIRRRRK